MPYTVLVADERVLRALSLLCEAFPQVEVANVVNVIDFAMSEGLTEEAMQTSGRAHVFEEASKMLLRSRCVVTAVAPFSNVDQEATALAATLLAVDTLQGSARLFTERLTKAGYSETDATEVSKQLAHSCTQAEMTGGKLTAPADFERLFALIAAATGESARVRSFEQQAAAELVAKFGVKIEPTASFVKEDLGVDTGEEDTAGKEETP